MNINNVSGEIIKAAFDVHSALGPGLLESTYETCLVYEIRQRGLEARSQVGLPVVYRGVKLDAGYRIDILVQEAVIVEVKAVEQLAPVHTAQVISYLKLSGKRLGLLLNFNVVHLRLGIKRLVNRL